MDTVKTKSLLFSQQVILALVNEAEAIRKTASNLSPECLEDALLLLANCQGKVVLSGVGKSGIVAQKIAATLASIGTTAIFLHPCDALHGDLGIVTSQDVAIVLSNSGETEELIAIMPHLKHRNVPSISIVGNLESNLAAAADVVLDASVDREACPLNLAPTTSTTVALAIGDALAMTLVNMKGLTLEDFAFNHPSGRLGKRLTLRVCDLLESRIQQVTLHKSSLWLELLNAITRNYVGAVNIVDENNRLIGLVTDGDIRRGLQKSGIKNSLDLIASDIMTTDPIVINFNALAYDALKLMENREHPLAVLPVVDDEYQCMGLLSLHDILRAGLK